MKIEHRKTAIAGAAQHRAVGQNTAHVQHRGANVRGGQHRRAEDVLLTAGSTPPVVDHREAAAPAAKLEHARVAPTDAFRAPAHRPANLTKAVSLDNAQTEAVITKAVEIGVVSLDETQAGESDEH